MPVTDIKWRITFSSQQIICFGSNQSGKPIGKRPIWTNDTIVSGRDVI